MEVECGIINIRYTSKWVCFVLQTTKKLKRSDIIMRVLKIYFLGLAVVAIFLGGAILGTAFPEWFPYFIGGIIVLMLLATSAGFAAWAVKHEIKKNAVADERKFETDAFDEALIKLDEDSDEAKSVKGEDSVLKEEDSTESVTDDKKEETTDSDEDSEFKPTSKDWDDIMSYSNPEKAKDEFGEAKAAATIKKADKIIDADQET